MPHTVARAQKFLQGGPDFEALFCRLYVRKFTMNEFLIDCSFKHYSMALKFDLLIQRYAILIPRYAA
jgi:hypothetical protein